MTEESGDTTVKRSHETVADSDIPSLSHISKAPPAILTLTTDFGTNDYFVAAMKGVILSINPQCQIVDITHHVPPQDIQTAAFTLLASYSSFPQGAIHVAVVDPGVGSARASILIETAGQFFVGPDNGIFSYVCEREGNCRIRRITNSRFFGKTISSTFHGRDLFAPVAAFLSKGVKPDEFGEVTTQYVQLKSLTPKVCGDKTVEGRIIHIDNFGNCVTNLTKKELPEELSNGARLHVNGKRITTFKKYFAQEIPGGEKFFGIWGSVGFLEIATTNGSAADLLSASRGQTVTMELSN